MSTETLTNQAQDLYDALTCAGIRHDLWPAAPGDDEDCPAWDLEEAFQKIESYLAAVKAREAAEDLAERYPDSLPFRVRILTQLADGARYGSLEAAYQREIALLRNGVAS
jgi:hypothetical protein